MSFTKNDLDKIKSKVSIKNELEKKTKIIQKGKDYWCCCPFHEEKTPSCKINEDQCTFYCFGCSAKGDIFTIYTDLYNYNFIDAVKELSLQAGLNIDFNTLKKNNEDNIIEQIHNLTCEWFESNLKNPSANICNIYLKDRKLNDDTIKKFRLGYSSNSKTTLYEYLKNKFFSDSDLLKSNIVKLDKNNKIRDFFYKRLMFPIMDINGKIIGFGARTLDNSNPKYLNSPESNFFQKRLVLYNLNAAKNFARKKNNLLICEGYMDVISLAQNGINSVVAPLGTALTEEQLQLSWKYSSRPTIMFDGDSAGIRASYKTAIMALKKITFKNFIQFVSLPIGYDPDSYIHEVSLEKLIKKLKNPENLSSFIFSQSAISVNFDKIDEKISFDKYLDDLANSIAEKQIKYFYRSEFKSLFFNKIRSARKGENFDTIPQKIENINLNKKQNLSFLAAAINHLSIRRNILDLLLDSKIFSELEVDFIQTLQKNEFINTEKETLFGLFKDELFIKMIKECLRKDVYELFPYCSPKFDPQKTLEQVSESLNNLNTRLLYLKKINKSLDSFVKESNQLNWDDLQSINVEILNED